MSSLVHISQSITNVLFRKQEQIASVNLLAQDSAGLGHA